MAKLRELIEKRIKELKENEGITERFVLPELQKLLEESEDG